MKAGWEADAKAESGALPEKCQGAVKEEWKPWWPQYAKMEIPVDCFLSLLDGRRITSSKKPAPPPMSSRSTASPPSGRMPPPKSVKARHDNISEFGHGLQLNVLAVVG